MAIDTQLNWKKYRMSIEINKVIFVLTQSPPKLVPGKIIEQIISRKLDGEDITHVVEFTNGKRYTLEKITKPWFPSLNDASLYLESEAKKLVSNVVNEGRVLASEHFGKNEVVTEDSPLNLPDIKYSSEQPKQESGDLVVDLGNGHSAKVTLPEVLK